MFKLWRLKVLTLVVQKQVFGCPIIVMGAHNITKTFKNNSAVVVFFVVHLIVDKISKSHKSHFKAS
jgi:hypothetical protein